MELKTRDRGFWLVAGALALLLAALITTLVVNVPINLAEAGWNVSNPPGDWADIRDRWQVGHAVRTFAAFLAFGALSAAAAATTDPPSEFAARASISPGAQRSPAFGGTAETLLRVMT
jgi:uncharacterized membrane protein